jgi:hypothetical protein
VSLEKCHSYILKGFLQCPGVYTCLKWAIDYQNFSLNFHDFIKEEWFAVGFWTDENKRPLLCELENVDFVNVDFTFVASKGSPVLKCIYDVMEHVTDAGIFMHVRN